MRVQHKTSRDFMLMSSSQPFPFLTSPAADSKSRAEPAAKVYPGFTQVYKNLIPTKLHMVRSPSS